MLLFVADKIIKACNEDIIDVFRIILLFLKSFISIPLLNSVK